MDRTTDISTCTNKACKTVTPGNHKRCPVCGKPAVSSAKIRVIGWLNVVIGVFLIGLMSSIWLHLAPAMAHAGQRAADGTSFHGNTSQVRFVQQLFALVILFGVVALVSGIDAIRRGRRNMILYGIMIALFALLIVQALRSQSVLKSDTTSKYSLSTVRTRLA